jgi:hypothetical protein
MSNKKNTPAENTTLRGELTAAELDALKQTHGALRKITVEVAGEKIVCYCKKPDRNTVAAALSKRGQNKVLEAGETILANCKVAGAEEFETNDNVRIAAAMECYSLLDFLPTQSEEV